MGDQWWRSRAILDSRLCDLVTGFGDIASVPIPYARLPRRLSTYAEEFSRWADVADQTPRALLARPRLGEAAVGALMDAAREAVHVRRDTISPSKRGPDAAVARLLTRLPDLDRALLAATLWAPNPMSQRALSETLGMPVDTVQRTLPRARRRFAELLADPAHRDVLDYATSLRDRLGTVAPDHVVHQALAELAMSADGDGGHVLLHVAGPYAHRDGWWEIRSPGGWSTSAHVVATSFALTPTPTHDDLAQALADTGMTPEAIEAFLPRQPGLRRVGNRWVRWGSSVPGKAEAVLHLLGAPATADDIAAQVGEDYRPGSIRAVLYSDERFIRVTRTTWALRSWGLVEYGGIYDAITALIDAAGGQISVSEIAQAMARTFPDVSEQSVRTYLHAPGFVYAGGMLRRRTAADGWPPVRALNTVRGVFRNGDNEIRVAVLVTDDALRGSSRHVSGPVAAAVGLTPGQQRVFTHPAGDVAVVWRISMTTGADIGSLRALIAATGAERDDTLVLAFDTRQGSVDAIRVPQALDPPRRLRLLLGQSGEDPVATLARSLQCRPTDLPDLLGRRGDADLLTLARASPSAEDAVT